MLTLADGLTREYLLHHKLCPRRLSDDGAELVLAAAPGALLQGADDKEAALERDGIAMLARLRARGRLS